MRPKNTPVSRQKSSRTTQKAFHFIERLVLLWFAIADYYALHRFETPFLGLLPRQQESNLYFTLRRHTFYPLNYGEPK